MRRLILASFLLFPVLAAPQDKDLDQAVSRTAAYVEAYTSELGGVISEERYVQTGRWSCGGCNAGADSSAASRLMDAFLDGGAEVLADGSDPSYAKIPSKSMARNLLAFETRERKLLSDFRTVPAGDAWFGMRQVREVDGIAIDPSFRGRLAEKYDLFTPAGLLQFKKAIDYENARYTIGNSYFTTNIPTLPLEVFRRTDVAGYSFQKRGEEVIDTVLTWKVEATGREGRLAGMFWIEPATGRILRAEFGTKDFVDRPYGPATWTTVRYAFNAAVGMMVPISMDEEFKEAGLLMGGQGHADYTNFRRFRTDVRLLTNDEDAAAATEVLHPAALDADPARARVPAVTVEAWVTGNNGPALNLKADDFVVTENKVPQTITNFSPAGMPYDVLLLFDRSGSAIDGKGPGPAGLAYTACGGPCSYPSSAMLHAAQALRAGLRPQDRIGVAGFGSAFHMLTHWSDTAEQASKTISQLSSFADVPMFYSAVEHSLVSELLPVAGRRRALVVLTEGRDNSITNSVRQLARVVPSDEDPVFLQMIDVAKREHIPVYVVALNTDRNLTTTGTTENDEYVHLQAEYFFKGLFHPADRNLRTIPHDYLVAVRTGMEQLAQASGGHIFFPKKWEDVVQLYGQIGEQISTTYSFGYVSSLPADNHGSREIAVTARDSRLHVVQSRTGYEDKAPEVDRAAILAQTALGQHSFDAGDFQTAADQLNEAVLLGSMSPNVYYMLGTSYYKLDLLDAAEANLLMALTIDPSFGNAYLQLYNVYMRGKKPEKALEAAEAYLTKYPGAADRDYVQSMVDKLKQTLKPPQR